MRIRYLEPSDPPEVREEYYNRARAAYNSLVKICSEYYKKLDPNNADVICLSLDIYRLDDVCVDYFTSLE